jgi:hypothetical protein
MPKLHNIYPTTQPSKDNHQQKKNTRCLSSNNQRSFSTNTEASQTAYTPVEPKNKWVEKKSQVRAAAWMSTAIKSPKTQFLV